MILAIDQGTTGTTCLVVDDELRAARPRVPRDRPALPRARAGSSTTRRRSGRACSYGGGGARRGRDRRGRPRRRSGSRTSARRRSCGSARPGGRSHHAIVWQDRRTAARCARAARGARAGAHRPRARPVLLGDEARVDPRPHRACRQSELAFGTVDSWLVWKLTGGDAPRHRPSRTRRARCCSTSTTGSWDDELLELFGVDRGDPARGRPVGGRRRRGRAARRDRARSPGSPATSRRRCSARAASRPARRRRRTAPAASCSRTSGTTLEPPPQGC